MGRPYGSKNEKLEILVPAGRPFGNKIDKLEILVPAGRPYGNKNKSWKYQSQRKDLTVVRMKS